MSLTVQAAWGAYSSVTLPTDTWTNHRASGYSSGSGTQDDPWKIMSAEELAYFAYQVTNNKTTNGTYDKSAYFSLQADIDLKDHIWVPIGNLSTGNGNSFSGNFEGNGHVIKNMMLQWEITNSTQAFGLFSTIQEKAVVKNLILDNAYLYNKVTTVTNPTADRLIAPFAGALKKNTTIQNIIVKNTKIEVVDKYNQNGRWMLFGGFIAKMLDNTNSYNVSNIYVDTDIDITKMTVNKIPAVYSSLFIPEFHSKIKDAPKNIYLKGSILASDNLTLVGPVFGTNLPSSSTYKDTWQINSANTYQYTTDGGTTTNALTTKNAGGKSVSSFDASSFNTFSSENDLCSWAGSADDPTLKKIVFPTLTKTRDKSIRNNKNVVCTVSAEGIDGTISYAWVVDGITQTSTTNTLTITSTNKQRICSVHVTNDNGYDYIINFTIEPIYYSTDLYADNFAGGEGTADNPYIINDDYQLAKLARDVNNGNKYSGIYFKLGADINLDEALWLPISQWDNSDSKFGGKFDGDGHTIKNMHLQWEAASGKWVNWGLFGSIKGTADKIENYASVTNLIIEDAVAEMKSSGTMTGQGLNVGIVSGEIYPYTEISNIILKGCRITDKDEVYSTTVGEHRIGGIVGNMEADASSDFFRIFNITTDTEVSAFVNATTNGKPIYISSGIGKSSFRSYTDAVRIFPKNIYLHGTAVKTKPSTTSNLNSGTLFGRTTSFTPTDAQMETWYYAFNNANFKNIYGNPLEFTDDNAKTFQDLLNKYITDNSLNDKLLWAYDSEKNKYYFGNIELTGDTVTNYTVSAPEGTYEWYLSSDKVTWKKIESGISAGTNSVEIPYQEYNQYVYAKSSTGMSKVLTVPALRIEAVTLNHQENSKDYSVSIVNSIWGEDNSKLNISYDWYINYDSSNGTNTSVSTGYSYTYDGSNPTTDQISCHIIVTYNDNIIADNWVGGSRIIYLCPAGVTVGDKTYAAGKDDNDGLTPDKPKLTWQGAYAALTEEGSWDENKIVLMGTSSSDATFSTTDPYKGFAITDNLSKDEYPGTYSTWKTTVEKSKLNRNTTISGKHGSVDYKGVIEMKTDGEQGGLGIFGDTRFEYLTFKHKKGKYDIIFCQYNNLEMGKGLIMENFHESPGYGTLDGAITTSLQIFGGVNNDNRFYPLNTEALIKEMEESMPHGREGFSMTFLSGHYSAICVGGRQNKENLNGLMGTANMPVKCTITMDIDRAWNDNNNKQGVHYDAGIIMAGNHEGAMFGDVDIVVKSGHVGRLVNGTLGAFRDANSTIKAPYNTFMGRASIKLDPRKDNNGKYIDSDIVVTELYGGSCGRGFTDGKTVDNPFYGYGKVVINGGTFKYLGTANDLSNILRGVFGAGAGGTNGIGDDAKHTDDSRIGYWNGNKMAFGNYETAKSNLLTYNCYNADTHTYTVINPLDTKAEVEINGGVFGESVNPIDGIYAGGSGYMAPGLWTSAKSIPSPKGGNIYGKKGSKVASLTINGGEFYCKNGVFAGGRGTNYYYEVNKYGGTASDYTSLGQIYGDVEMTINGGNFHCPVFGGGYGVADAILNGTSTINTLSDMALITGQSNVYINGGTFFDNIYGGGDMARIFNENADATSVFIADRADIRGSVFAGGNGRQKRLDGETYAQNDKKTQSPELVGKVTGNTNVYFQGLPKLSPYIYGDIFGGGNLAVVEGNTNINLYAGNFAGEIFGGGKGLLKADGTVQNSANITGNTNVTLTQDQGGQEENEEGSLEDQFSINVIWDKLWDGSNSKFVTWEENSTQFYNAGVFINPHNIYGGGKNACIVGTYDESGHLTPGTGTATVNVQKGMTPFSLLTTDEWKQSYTDNDNPHFYVFGGGYGKNTKVGNTDVTVNVEGEYGIYNTEIDDPGSQLSPSDNFRKRSNNRTKIKSGEGTETGQVFDNSKGIPNFTILGVLGGGYAGMVSDNTKVTVDGKTFLHRVYGGGFGDPNASSADDKTGQVGGNTEVYIKGANTYGDVFGGGAGVTSNGTIDFKNVARVLGTTKVEISDDASIFGNVYGGGDIANIGEDTTPDYKSAPSSVSEFNQTDGSVTSYTADNYKTFVNIIGGDIFGEVYAGGKGLKKENAVDYTTLGKVNGNTLLHIANTDNGVSSISIDDNGNNIPYVWSHIYGGCSYGTVDGNTLVHVEGGMLGDNIFGGGYGYLPLENDDSSDAEFRQVIGKKDASSDATYANVLGNTKVQIDGGSWIWNRDADVNGNIIVWDDANKKIVADEDAAKTLITEVKAAALKGNTELKTYLASKNININPNFFNIDNFTFVKQHNIFGGGNKACFVGSYSNNSSSDPTSPNPNTGKAMVEINHSPLTKVTITNEGIVQTYNMFDKTSLAGLCWYISTNGVENPQFSVFGAGLGVNTKVGSTEVLAQPGTFVDNSGSLLEIKGSVYRYSNQVTDMSEYQNFNDEIYNDYNDPKKVTTEDKILYYGSADGSGNDPKTFLRYRSSRLAWSFGISGFTFKDIHGGGFSGYVCDDTKVVTDNQLSCRKIFGGGLGARPYTYTAGDKYDFGSVKSTNVFIKSGVVSNDVFGGGAGVMSIKNNSDEFVDFDDMARVKEGTKVHVYGEKMTVDSKDMERTIIFGSVFGGGDVANVGTSKSDAVELKNDNIDTTPYTTNVDIRGGSLFSYIFAGGKGRLNSQCNNYKTLGGVYGNTHVIIDYPHNDMKYPYLKVDGTAYDPADYMTKSSGITTPNATANILNRVYGGCQNGTVYGNTVVDIENGNFGYNFFGGGWGDITDNEDVPEEQRITSADVTGNSHVFINGGNALLTSYWLTDKRNWEPASINGKKVYSPQYNPETRKFKINHNIYGGGNLACQIEGNTYVTMTRGILKDNTRVIGNDDTNFFETDEWKETYYKVGSPHFAVFGGGYGENTNVKKDTHVAIHMETYKGIENKPDLVAGEDYKHFVSDYSAMDIIGGGYSGKVTGNSNVYVSGIFCRRIFGGGFYNTVNTTNIDIDMVDCHDIFGGGLMGDVLNTTNIKVGKNGIDANNNADIYIHGNIYGGNDVSGYVNIGLNEAGEFTDLKGEGTKINIYGGHIDGNVYGAGNGDYLYALDRKGNEKVTVNEHYLLKPDDPSSEQFDLVYTVPMRETMPSYKSASDAAKIVNINSWRPLTNKVYINIEGNNIEGDCVTIKGDVYGGGNSATVLKVYSSDGTETVGSVKINIGSHVKIGRVFMGCNGDALFTASEDNAFMTNFRKLNGDFNQENGDLDLGKSIDWLTDPSNKGISTLYLPTKNEERPLVYPHLLDLYFQPVEMDIQGDLTWNGTAEGDGLVDCEIGTFCCGGNRGNMNVYPKTEGKKGNVFEYTFPKGLTITDKIVGGCNNANYIWNSGENKVYHEGGYLLGLAKSEYPFIKLNIKNEFSPTEVDNAYVGGNVYGGCYETGTVRGDITIDLQSDMLNGKNKDYLDKSNELLSSNPKYSALNVYGAGYGMESYVYGNPNIIVAKGLKCKEPASEITEFAATGTSANFIYGGGQQGNVIGVTNVEIFNGHIYKSVTGGSYSGYVWGSTHVKVGYPKYYTVKFGKTGKYLLNRIDQANKDIDKDFKAEGDYAGMKPVGETIKQSIYLVTGDFVSEGVYNDIVAIDNSTPVDNGTPVDNSTPVYIADKSEYFEEVKETLSDEDWSNINIKIGEAVYGGGYSLAQGASVMANNTTVLKFTDTYNLDNAFTTNEAHKAELASLPYGTTRGFGGNTTVLVADRVTDTPSPTDRDHISISHQEMKVVTDITTGTDLQGYYYKDKTGNYRYIYMAGRYYSDGEHKIDISKNQPSDIGADLNVYEYDNEGGIFGDGHLSYAEGFRCADLKGYGFASTTVQNPKILNTFQRMDVLRLTDNCFTLLGARDYATNSTDKTLYSVSRVSEIQMVSDKVTLSAEGNLNAQNQKRSRNYMGFANNIHYVGAINSNVKFTDDMFDENGELMKKSYKTYKQEIIDEYFNNKETNTIAFSKRNSATAKNMVGVASGYALKIQNVQELKNSNDEVVDKTYYGPIYGVIEMNLIDVREDEGGGYVYADNIHKRSADDEKTQEDFLETTGNFVFPASSSDRYIVDDCFPKGYDKNAAQPAGAEIHYWYVTGYNYYYNAHITGYTSNKISNKSNKFFSRNDEIMVLSGMKPGQTIEVIEFTKQRDYEGYECDLSNRNYKDEAKDHSNQPVKGKYNLYVSAPDTPLINGSYTEGDGFYATLPLNGMKKETDVNYTSNTLPTTESISYPKILFMLSDEVDNSTSEYYNAYLSKPYKATVVLAGEAKSYEVDDKGVYTGNLSNIMDHLSLLGKVYTKNEDNTYTEATKLESGKTYYYRTGEFNLYQLIDLSQIFKRNESESTYTQLSVGESGVVIDNTIYAMLKRYNTYTIDLTIEYVQGPDITGNISIVNCALPGEVIRLKKDKITIDADDSFSANGYYWRIGKDFDASDTWVIDGTAANYDVYKVGDDKGKGLFSGCYYNNTEDYLEIPAYYFMNGYKVQLGVTMNRLDGIFSAPMLDSDKLVVHNYHQMDPHAAGVNLHLAEAVARASSEPTTFAEPRIYISDQKDIKAFAQFVDTIGAPDYITEVKIGNANVSVPRYGQYAQFVLQNNITVPDDYVAPKIFSGLIHGNGNVLSGIAQTKAFIKNNEGKIYNLGLASGKIAASNTNDGKYHCCFEYKTAEGGPYVYRLDGSKYDGYTNEDFLYGKVAYDLNQYYLEARNNIVNNDNLQYVKDYFANGDYQYAYRKDEITGNATGIKYLRTGSGTAVYPNYGNYETRHDKNHTIDSPRAQKYVAAHTATEEDVAAGNAVAVGDMIPETRTGNYLPLLNSVANEGETQVTNTETMNDYLFWGQNLQITPDAYPSRIMSNQVSDMTNRVYRAAGYYRDTKLSTYHYNAFKRNNTMMGTYVYKPSTTAIDFTCKNDLTKAVGYNAEGIYYAPVADLATTYSKLFVKAGVSRNLLVYTPDNDEESSTDVYDAVSQFKYGETTNESEIQLHHIVFNDEQASTSYLHLVERADESDDNNDFCAPLSFTVTDRAWYTRKPKYYSETGNDAWEGICLPFTVNKAEASLNGEITHFYGTARENTAPADNHWNLHHEYWLRGMTEVNSEGTKATFKRPGEGLFEYEPMTKVSYTFYNDFFVNTYGGQSYNTDANSYYTQEHIWDDYLPLTSSIPYIISLPGKSFYEFDLTSEFYNRTNSPEPAQTVTFNAYGDKNVITIPVTGEMKTNQSSHAHVGTFVATETETGSIYGMNDTGVGFDDQASSILPFRTYIRKNASPAPGTKQRSSNVSVIYIAQTAGIENINPEIGIHEEEPGVEENSLIVTPVGKNCIRIESTYATTVNVYNMAGQIYRVLDVRPGTATYSGIQSGFYIVGKTKIKVQ